MISEKDYNEIYLKGYEDGKNDNDNLKISYEIKPSFTTRKLKELQKENKQLKEVIDDCKEDISNLLDIINKNCNELKCTSDEWLVIQKYQNKEVSE